MRAALVATACLILAPACESTEVRMADDFVAALEVDAASPSKVLRMELDVTGDGVAELFVGTTHLGGAFGNAWVVYTPVQSGKWRRLGALQFHYEGFYFSAEAARLSVYVRASATSGGFTRYRVDSAGFHELAEPYGSVEEERGRVEAWKASGRPRLFWATLSDVLGSGSPTWRDFKTEEIEAELGRLDGAVVQ